MNYTSSKLKTLLFNGSYQENKITNYIDNLQNVYFMILVFRIYKAFL